MLVTAGLLAAPAAFAPATAATGPVPLHDHLAAQPTYITSVSSSAAGTVFVGFGGRVNLLRAPITAETVRADLGPAGPQLAGLRPRAAINGTRVTIPRSPDGSTLPTSVDWCLVDTCPEFTTFPVPEGYAYLGDGGDVAILRDAATNTLGLAPWAGGELQAVGLGDLPPAYLATGDATGVLLTQQGKVTYVERPSLALTTFAAAAGALTPTSVVWSQGAGTEWVLRRVPRATPAAEPTVVATPTSRTNSLVANDAGAAWFDSNGRYYSLAYGSAPVSVPTAQAWFVAPYGDGVSFVAQHGDGIYATPAGSTTRTFLTTLRPPAITSLASLAHGRAAFVDDSRYPSAAYVRRVDGQPVAELEIAPGGGPTGVAISGPHVAWTYVPDTDGTVGTYFGRLGGKVSVGNRFPGGAGTRPVVSGHRLLLTGGARSTLVDTRTSAATDLGSVVATLFGDLLVTADNDGRVVRRNLATGAVDVVRAATPCASCALDKLTSRVSAWGGDVLYALELGGSNRLTGLWSGGTTKPLPMLAGGWSDATYYDGLLLAQRGFDTGVDLYDLRSGGHVVVDAEGAMLPGRSLDGTTVAWASSALRGRAVVRPLAELVPGHVPTPKYLSSEQPAGFGPGLPAETWRPRWYVSEPTAWQLELRRGSATGTLVRTLTGSNHNGEVVPIWDGRTAGGALAPHGTYAWRITTAAGTRGGSVFLSRVAPPAPKVTAPVLASDASADGTFRVSWSGAPAGMRYVLHRSVDGGYFRPLTTTTKTSTTFTGRPGHTYRIRVAVVDKAGRVGPGASRSTVAPHDDTAGGGLAPSHWTSRADGRLWRGSHSRSTTAYDRYSISVRGSAVWLVGTRGPAYGRFRVYVDGRDMGTYDAYSATQKYRQVLFRMAGLLPDYYHSVEVEVLPTPGRTLVSVDGVGARRSMASWAS